MSTLGGANDSPKIAPRQYGSCGITPATFMPPIRHTASAAEETEAAAITTPHAVSRMKNNIAAIAARPSPTTTSGLPAVFFCVCARFAEPGGKRRRIAEPCGDLLLGVAVGLKLAQDGIGRAVGNVDALLQPVGYLVVVAVTLVQQCQHAQLEHALCQ